MSVAWRCLIILLFMFPAQASETNNAVLDAVLAGFSNVRHVEARYVERRFLAVLRAPLETRGTLRFDAPDRLEKASDPGADGVAERVVVAGSLLTVEHGAAPVVLDLREHPEVAALVESVRALLAGDGAALRRDFEINLAGDAARWQMVLSPRRRDLVRWLRVDGMAAAVTRIETQEADGDRSELVVGESAR